MRTRHEAAFTLLELLVVIAIIGILAAIGIPQYSEYRTRAFNARAQSDLHNATIAQETAYIDRGVYWDCMNNGCNSPALPGLRVSPGVSIACTPRANGEIYQCSTRHINGTITYYYDSENSAMWQM
jgi:type IV pilus assembly protein PilA